MNRLAFFGIIGAWLAQRLGAQAHERLRTALTDMQDVSIGLSHGERLGMVKAAINSNTFRA